MNANEIVNEINDHDELAAQILDNGDIYVTKVDEKSIGNELIGDYIERIAGREILKNLKIVNVDESADVVTYTIAR